MNLSIKHKEFEIWVPGCSKCFIQVLYIVLYNHPSPWQTSQKIYISVVTAWAAHRAHTPNQCCKVVLADGLLGRQVKTHTSELVLVFKPLLETPSNCLVLSRLYIYSKGDLI